MWCTCVLFIVSSNIYCSLPMQAWHREGMQYVFAEWLSGERFSLCSWFSVHVFNVLCVTDGRLLSSRSCTHTHTPVALEQLSYGVLRFCFFCLFLALRWLTSVFSFQFKMNNSGQTLPDVFHSTIILTKQLLLYFHIKLSHLTWTDTRDGGSPKPSSQLGCCRDRIPF